jgi:hypothetical protein
MTNRAQLQKAVAEAERELEAATKLSDVKAAATKLQRAKAELRELDSEALGQSKQRSDR